VAGKMQAVRFKIIPADEGFFDLFAAAAKNNHRSAKLLHDVFMNYEQRESIREQIRQAEHEGDEITHKTMRRINTTFVTPFDREDIYRLASDLDNVMDHIDAASDFLVLHDITEPLPQFVKQTDVLCRAAASAEEAVGKLHNLRGLDEYWVEINRLENEGDQIYRKTVAHLFSGDFKGLEVLRYRDVVEEIEAAIDSLEDVANVIESIALKHA
jgi:predicted phosphate transport protein (TIGR00153 family)